LTTFKIGDIIIPKEGHKGNAWIVINILQFHEGPNSYALQNLEDEDEVELMYCYHMEQYYERAND
jgi:hypothetical protein